nr:RecName: Full=Phospholipase A2 1; Short=PLA2; AltName: Full=Phospholipase OcyPLA2_1 [Opisthacanthus cayaporum]
DFTGVKFDNTIGCGKG